MLISAWMWSEARHPCGSQGVAGRPDPPAAGDRHGEHRDLPNRRDPDRVYHEKNKHSDQTGGNPKGDWGTGRASRRGVVQVGLLPLVESVGRPGDPRSRP